MFKISSMNTKGETILNFNQDMIVPAFVNAMNLDNSKKSKTRRSLTSLDELDPSEFLEIVVVVKGNEPPS